MKHLSISTVLVTVLLAGCNASQPEPAANPEPSAPTESAEPSPAPPGQTESATASSAPVSLKILDWESTLRLVEKKRGEIVVLDLWSTYCPPCIAEFPGLVELHRQYPKDVACISVSADYDGYGGLPVQSYQDKVLGFLQKQGAVFDNILLSTDAETLFQEKIEQQSLPVVFVFDREGNLAAQFPDPQNPAEFTYEEHIFPIVEKLLAKD